MDYRTLGRTGWQVSAVSLGAWQFGTDWGTVTDDEALATLHKAVEMGVNFIDTADVYGAGRSEQLIARFLQETEATVYVATKAGRFLNPHVAEGYNAENLTRFVDSSLRNLNTDRLDLLQLHCPPTEVYYRPEVFGALDDLVAAGKIQHYGVSVEKVEEALKAIEYPNVKTVQIIFNMFRMRPAGLFFAAAQARQIGVLARVPLASGLLAGKMTRERVFDSSDHRHYNRHGDAFDVGETFAGVDFETGLQAVEALRGLVPAGATMAQFALRWILMHPAVSCVIPGAKNPAQAADNIAAADLPPLSDDLMAQIQAVYDDYIRAQVHQRW